MEGQNGDHLGRAPPDDSNNQWNIEKRHENAAKHGEGLNHKLL